MFGDVPMKSIDEFNHLCFFIQYNSDVSRKIDSVPLSGVEIDLCGHTLCPIFMATCVAVIYELIGINMGRDYEEVQGI